MKTPCPGTYQLVRQQWLALPPPQVFAFFSEAGNLNTITPGWMHFRIRTPAPIEMKSGTRLDYTIRWRGLPLRWTTLIEDWEPPHRFTDRQLSGPYTLWRHTHLFEDRDGGTLMTDVVDYALPCGPLGRWVHRLWVKRDLGRIFDYRFERIGSLFPSAAPAPSAPARVGN